MIRVKSLDVVARWVGSWWNLALFVLTVVGLVSAAGGCQAQEVLGMALSDVSLVAQVETTCPNVVVIDVEAFLWTE